MLPGIAVVIVLGIAFRRFVLELPALMRMLIVLAGTVYVGGTVGAELVGGLIISENWNNAAFLWIRALEEVAEMLGIALFIYALLIHLGGRLLRIQVGPDSVESRETCTNR